MTIEEMTHADFLKWLNAHVEIVETADHKWMICIDGVQYGNKRDSSGAGNFTFSSKSDAYLYAMTGLRGK